MLSQSETTEEKKRRIKNWSSEREKLRHFRLLFGHSWWHIWVKNVWKTSSTWVLNKRGDSSNRFDSHIRNNRRPQIEHQPEFQGTFLAIFGWKQKLAAALIDYTNHKLFICVNCRERENRRMKRMCAKVENQWNT